MRKIVEAGCDFANDEMRYSVTEESGQAYEVRIPLTGKAQAQPSPEAKINEWLENHPAQAEPIRIPGYHFHSF